MTLLQILSPMGSPLVPCSRGIGVVYKLVKWSAVPQVESNIDSCANIFGCSYEVDALQNNHLKNNCLLSVPFPTLYAVKLCRNCWYKPFPNPSRRYVISLGGKTNKVFHLNLHLPSSSITPFRCVPGFWCTQSWLTPNSALSEAVRQTPSRSLSLARR